MALEEEVEVEVESVSAAGLTPVVLLLVPWSQTVLGLPAVDKWIHVNRGRRTLGFCLVLWGQLLTGEGGLALLTAGGGGGGGGLVQL